MATSHPLCFILMPFGIKTAPEGGTVNFDAVYEELIQPAVVDAGLEPLRADQELNSGIIHKPMYERLILCPFAVADLTMANPNVYYELGVRHAFRPASTVQLMAEGTRLPFDIQMLRTVPYRLGAGGGPDSGRLPQMRAALTAFLEEAKSKGAKDSPIFQLLDNLQEPIVDHLKTDVFRDRVDYSNKWKEALAAARRQGIEAVRAVEAQLGDIGDCEAGIVIDLFLSYRSTEGFAEMIALTEKMTGPLAQSTMVREQLGFALNRLKRRDEAQATLLKVIEEKGPSSETYGLLGRVYKDRWDEEAQAGHAIAAQGFLEKAVSTYLKGFEADWRDAFPGINAVTLMELSDPPDERRAALIPVVRYAVERRMAQGQSSYWDYATLMELAVIGMNAADAARNLSRALSCSPEMWQRKTTARNLRLIRETREKRGTVQAWEQEIEDELLQG